MLRCHRLRHAGQADLQQAAGGDRGARLGGSRVDLLVAHSSADHRAGGRGRRPTGSSGRHPGCWSRSPLLLTIITPLLASVVRLATPPLNTFSSPFAETVVPVVVPEKTFSTLRHRHADGLCPILDAGGAAEGDNRPDRRAAARDVPLEAAAGDLGAGSRTAAGDELPPAVGDGRAAGRAGNDLGTGKLDGRRW